MRLCVNIDHAATIRNARGGDVPDPVAAALTAERAGADGIVCHLREDRRHIRDKDVERLRSEVSTKLDLEMAATPEIIAVARRIKPDLSTLVPEKRKELTTEGGLDVAALARPLGSAVKRLHDRGILVSFFIDPVKKQVDAAKEAGADIIEIHTGEYADARAESVKLKHLAAIVAMARYARSLGLGVNAGHGLDYANVTPIASIREIEEVSIGHAIVVRALEIGLDRAVAEMVKLVKGG